MAKKLKLQIDAGSDFRILALSSTAKSHKMAFLINQALETDLIRVEDFIFYNETLKQHIPYSLFIQNIPNSNGKICLLQNRHPEGFLSPHFRQVDYFLLFHENPQEQIIPDYLKKLKKTAGVIAAFSVDNISVKNTGLILQELEIHLMEQRKK